MFDKEVDMVLRDVCLEIEKRYQVKFLEIGVDESYVHFLVVRTVPSCYMFTSWEGLKMVKRVYKRYSEAFRLHVVKEYEEGAGIRQLQKKYGITGTPTIYNWVKKYSKEGLRDHLNDYPEARREGSGQGA